MPQPELRAGQQVIVKALGHAMFDLEAMLVPIAK